MAAQDASLANVQYESFSSERLAARRQDPPRAAARVPAILVIDDADINRQVLRAMLRAESYRILEARRAEEALAIVERENVDLVILELMMSGVSGPDLCSRLKAGRKTQLIPILMLTSVHGIENEIAGIASGADEFLVKPLHPAVVRARVRAMLRTKAAIDSLEEVETILFALAQSIEHRDRYTAGHCERLAFHSLRLGKTLDLPRRDLVSLYRGGFLHDIGKIGVPDAILHKSGRLTEDEWIIMRTHPVRGEEICRPMKSLAGVLPIIRSHHERWDGSGYPDGLAGNRIPIGARILQVADVYDALTTVRPYKDAIPHDAAIAILSDEADRGWWDRELVSLFKSLHHGGNGRNGHPEPAQRAQLDRMREVLSDPNAFIW